MKKSEPVGILVLDIDGTLFRWSLLIYLVEYLVKLGVWPETVRLQFSHAEKLWRDRKTNYDQYLIKIINVFEEHLKGTRESDVDVIGCQLFREYKDQVYTYTRDLITQKKDEGWLIWAISHSPHVIIKKFATYWGFDDFKGTELIVEGGFFTGKRILQKNKFRTLQGLLSMNNLGGYPKERIFFIDDSEGGKDLFEALPPENITLFNGTKKMRALALVKCWRLVYERKNDIHVLDPVTGMFSFID